ncbi:MAG: phosphatidylserine decarboxylase family protein [Candidatus Brocadiia bacterium]
MRWPFTAYARRELALSVVVLGGATALLAWQFVWAAPVPALLLVFVLCFFRDPERRVPGGEGQVVSPADGRVVDLEEVAENEFLGEQAVCVGIFMSVFDVHVNRAPLGGKVVYRSRRAGKFHDARTLAARRENASASLGLESGGGTRLLVRQVAGLVARRIVCACAEGDELAKGQRFGMVKFGSRLEVYVPVSAGFRPLVGVGDRVRAGSTVLGQVEGREGGEG